MRISPSGGSDCQRQHPFKSVVMPAYFWFGWRMLPGKYAYRSGMTKLSGYEKTPPFTCGAPLPARDEVILRQRLGYSGGDEFGDIAPQGARFV
jgi:hypothetical protein